MKISHVIMVATTLGVIANPALTFDATFDSVELYKGGREKDGSNSCLRYLVTELYSINGASMNGVKMKRKENGEEKVYDMNHYRPDTNQLVFYYCVSDLAVKTDAEVKFMAPDAMESAPLSVNIDLSNAKALKPSDRPLAHPLK